MEQQENKEIEETEVSGGTLAGDQEQPEPAKVPVASNERKKAPAKSIRFFRDEVEGYEEERGKLALYFGESVSHEDYLRMRIYHSRFHPKSPFPYRGLLYEAREKKLW